MLWLTFNQWTYRSINKWKIFEQRRFQTLTHPLRHTNKADMKFDFDLIALNFLFRSERTHGYTHRAFTTHPLTYVHTYNIGISIDKCQTFFNLSEDYIKKCFIINSSLSASHPCLNRFVHECVCIQNFVHAVVYICVYVCVYVCVCLHA